MRYAPTRFALAPALLAALLFSSPVAAQPGVLDEVDRVEIDQSLLADDDGLDDGGMSTIAVVGVTSYDQLMSEVGFLGGLVGRPQTAQMIDGTIALFTQGKGLVGLDKTRPWGVVLQTDGAQFTPLVCLPISDLDAILDLLVGFQIESEEIGDGVYEIVAPDQIVYAKQMGEWVYVGQNEGALDSAPADPTGVLADLVDDYDLAARLLVQNVPELFKQMAIGQLLAGLQAGLEQQDNESDEAFARRRGLAEMQVQQITDAINDMDELTVGWSVDAAKETTHLDMTLTAVPDTNAAAQFAALKESKTSHSGFIDPSASILLRSSTVTPADQIEQQRAQLTEMLAQMKQQITAEIETSSDLPDDDFREALKQVMADLFEVAEATALSGVADLAFSADVAADRLSAVGAATVQKTDKVEAALRRLDTLVKEKAGGGFPGFVWNAASLGGADFHTLTLPLTGSEPPLARELLGEQGLELAVGIGKEVVYLALGRGAMSRVEEAINASLAAGKTPALPFEMVVSLGDLMQFAKGVNPDTESAAVTAMLADMLAGANGDDHLRLTVEPLGFGARYRLEAEKGVLKAIGAAAAAAQQARGAGF